MNVIELNGILKEYDNLRVVDNLNLQVKEGEIYGFLGPNGAGKSTTIGMICNTIRPTSGEIFIYNHNIATEFRKVSNCIGLVPQNIALYQQYTAAENVKLFGDLYHINRSEIKNRVQQALKQTGLEQVADKQAKKFSGGMLRRLNIACALVHNPKILIMDEPTVGIDPQSRNYILDTIKGLNAQGTTIIYCSHYMEEVEALCNNIIIMDKGKRLIEGTKDYLKNSVDVNKTLKLTVDFIQNEMIEHIKVIEGVLSILAKNYNEIEIVISKDANNLSEIISFITEQGITISNIQYEDVTLETVFLALTGKKLRD